MAWLPWKKQQQETSRSAVSRFADIVSDVLNQATALTWGNLFGTLNHEHMYANNADASLKLSAVKCAIDIYTGMIGSLPRRMYALEAGTGAKQRIVSTTDHPASRIFSHYYHPELSSDDALITIIYDILMDGNCYFIRENDAQGRISRLYYIHPTRIPRGNIYRSQGGDQLSNGRRTVPGELVYRIDTGDRARDVNAQPLLLLRSEIAHFKGKVLDSEFHRAHGFIAMATKSNELYAAAEEYARKYYTKGHASQTWLTTEHRLAPEVLKRLEASFEENPNDSLDALFRTRILEQNLKPVNVGTPMQQLQFIETRAFSVEDVARGFNIPPVLLHSYMGTAAGNTDLSQAIAMFVQTGIGPFLSRLQSQFRQELLPLPSQMLFGFEFETLYLYRNVIDKFTSSLRNLFEIGMIDRVEGRALLGLHIDPSDPAANPRYVPVNIMTVDHSLHLEKGAELANKMTEAQTESTVKANEGMVSGEEHEALQEKAAAKSEPTSGKMDKSPSKANIDKRIRNAFMNVVNGLKQYETRVLDQKKQSRPDDYEEAVKEFYTAGGKFHNMMKDQLMPWSDTLNYRADSPSVLITEWLSSQKSPEGIENEITCTES